MYDGGIRVPLVVRWPDHVKADTTSDHICGFQDLLPTVAALAGSPAPQDTDGISFLPTLLGKPDQQKQHEYLYWEFYEGTFAQAVRMGRWKGVRKGVDGPIELYDVVADLGEQNNVAKEHPEVVKQVAAAMKSAHTPSERWQPKGQRREQSRRP
jgi:arylsulfatase A-like enzyme